MGLIYSCISFRLILMKRPLHYKRSITKSRLHLALTAMCVLSTVKIGAGYYLCRKDIKQTDIRSNVPDINGLFTIFLINFGLMSIVMTVSFTWTTFQLLRRKRKKYIFGSKLPDVLRSDSKFTTALSISFGIYLLTFVPAFASTFIIRIVEVPHSDIFIDVSFLIHFINTFVNPFIYFVMLKDFREGYKNLLLCKNRVENQDGGITANVLQEIHDSPADIKHFEDSA